MDRERRRPQWARTGSALRSPEKEQRQRLRTHDGSGRDHARDAGRDQPQSGCVAGYGLGRTPGSGSARRTRESPPPRRSAPAASSSAANSAFTARRRCVTERVWRPSDIRISRFVRAAAAKISWRSAAAERKRLAGKIRSECQRSVAHQHVGTEGASAGDRREILSVRNDNRIRGNKGQQTGGTKRARRAFPPVAGCPRGAASPGRLCLRPPDPQKLAPNLRHKDPTNTITHV